MQCTAKSKRTGERCKSKAVTGREVCRMHGGKSLAGIASPTFKTGRWSKHLPQGLLDAHNDIQNDPEIMSVRQDIQLLDALLVMNLKKLDTNESGEAWNIMRKAVDLAEMSYNREDMGGMQKAFRDMRDVIDVRVAHYATEEEIRSKLDQRRKMVETEKKLMLQDERAITAERAMLLVSALLDSVRRHVIDPSTLSAVQADFIRLTAGANSNGVVTLESTTE